MYSAAPAPHSCFVLFRYDAPLSRPALALAGLLVLAVAGAAAAAELPHPVSPGQLEAFAEVPGNCPTFSWGQVDAESYEIAVYRLEEKAWSTEPPSAEPVWRQSIAGRAGSFSPAAGQCLKAGAGYGWAVRAIRAGRAGQWSPPLFFRVATLPPQHEVAAALRLLEGYLAAGGSLAALRLDPAAPEPGREASLPAASPAPSSEPREVSAAGAAAMRGENTDTGGAALGVAGITHSAAGAALFGDNLAGGPDLLLAGSGGAASLELSESGLRRSSASSLVFEFENPGAGSLQLTVDGVPVITAATDQDSLGELACADGQVAKYSSGSWACGEDLDTPAGGGEIFAAVLAQDGSGSGLDADLLDGQSAVQFLPALANGETIGNEVDQVIRFSDGADSLDLDLTAATAAALRTGGYQHGLDLEPGPIGPPTGAQERGAAVRLIGGQGQFTWGGIVPGGEVKAGGANHNTGDCAFPSGGSCGGHVTISGGGGGIVGTSGGGNVILRGGTGTGGWSTGHVLILDSRVGIGLLQPSAELEVSGKVKATQFEGDGSLLTGLPGATASGLECTACVSPGELDFDPATESELSAAIAGRLERPPVLALSHEFDRLPDAPQWIVTTSGLGQLLQANPSFVRLDSGFGGAGSVDLVSTTSFALSGGALVFRGEISAYRDGGVYGDRQPRGLAHGRDRGEAIEFLSASPTSVEMRTASGGGATSSFASVDDVYRFHAYQIYAAADEVRFYIDGAPVAVHTTHIPSAALNVYLGTSYAGAGTVPLDVDFISFERID
jgi:hypothetical protein